MEKNNNSTFNSDAYKAYLMELIVSIALNEIQHDMTAPDPESVAGKWGITLSNTTSDMIKARNVLTAVKLFISKAVDDNLT